MFASGVDDDGWLLAGWLAVGWWRSLAWLVDMLLLWSFCEGNFPIRNSRGDDAQLLFPLLAFVDVWRYVSIDVNKMDIQIRLARSNRMWEQFRIFA